MYRWLWDHLPGGTALRTAVTVAAVALVVVVLFGWVFPWVSETLLDQRGSVG